MMRLVFLRVRDFRNIGRAALAFGDGLNLVTGGNGQGKTNLLEAVGLLATGRSLRRAPTVVMGRHGQEGFALLGETEAGGLAHRIEVHGQGERMAVRLDGKAMSGVSAMGQALAAVILTPDSLELVKGAPGERRRYLDWLAFGLEREHAPMARDYHKALEARNRLLRLPQTRPGEFDAWEDRLAVLGARLTLRRRRVLERLEEGLIPLLAAMELPGEGGRLLPGGWLAEEGEEEELVRRLRERLLGSREGDRRRGASSIGPHRDDLLFRLEGRPLARYGSQGQLKRFVLALKLAEAGLLRQALGEPPLLLLDDPMAELDARGMMRFLELVVAQGGYQVFLTTCDPGEVSWPWPEWGAWRVDQGEFRRL